jgi:hypothetical protein
VLRITFGTASRLQSSSFKVRRRCTPRYPRNSTPRTANADPTEIPDPAGSVALLFLPHGGAVWPFGRQVLAVVVITVVESGYVVSVTVSVPVVMHAPWPQFP